MLDDQHFVSLGEDITALIAGMETRDLAMRECTSRALDAFCSRGFLIQVVGNLLARYGGEQLSKYLRGSA